jgi:hypothetical protein
MRKTAFLIFAFMPLFALTQGKAFYQLEYKSKPNYTESNQFLTDSIWRLRQTVEYNIPNMSDEETWTKLEIQIKDTTAFLQRRILDLKDDSLVAKHYFKVVRIWNNDQDSTSITGQIQLLSLTHEGILLNLNLKVSSLKTQNQFIYTGKRMFYNYKDPSFKDLLKRIPSASSK